MRHPSMSTRGTRWAALIAVVCAFFIPKRVECGFPGAHCERIGRGGATCTRHDLEPWGFYLIESLAHQDVGFAYSSDDDCR
jgi:hypothetical protein